MHTLKMKIMRIASQNCLLGANIFNLKIFYTSGSQSVVRVPLVIRRGISELNINQAACPPKRFIYFFLFIFFKWERLFHAEHSGVFFSALRI